MKAIKDITFDDIKSVYSGRNGKCCCGCAGKHYYSTGSRHLAPTYYGDDLPVSNRMVTRVLNLMREVGAEPKRGLGKEYYFERVDGNRLYLLYVKEAA